jgi:hypothetical protein
MTVVCFLSIVFELVTCITVAQLIAEIDTKFNAMPDNEQWGISISAYRQALGGFELLVDHNQDKFFQVVI